ncbi:hypothetical protein [Streptomyces qinzhouensis]|uniref:Uncharacterized protein n=1 Tax=Streptomyces qinzhouensis TaxID=2599401 RepID=A0A5B8IMF9_9ACTN|nr:hypothetical protein [Streptomyces qinzhouensis]QDY79798.1 hypothetical protein FQU76_28345 [Streptomyces qinzhouensis]
MVTDRTNVPAVLAEVYGFELPVTFGNVYSAGIAIQQCRAEAFQVSVMPTRPTTLAEITQHGTWSRTARLDTPIDPLRVIPEVSGSAWDAITEIARCTLATAEFDADGIFRWRNRTRWTNVPTVPDVTVTSAREIASVTVSEEIDACRNNITVPWTNWRNVKLTPLPGFGEETASIAIAAGATLRREFTISEDRYDPRTPQVAEQAFPDCVGITTTATGSTGAHGVVDVRVQRVGGTVTLSLTNRGTTTVYYRGVYLIALTHDNGSNPVTILAQSQHVQSQGYYGIQHYAHDPKGWIQDSNTAVTLAGALREAGAWPIPVISDVEILPDPRIELGDVVRVIDHTGTRLNTLAWVTGIKTSGETGSVRQVLTLRAVASTGAPVDSGLTPDPPVNPGALLST